MYYFCDGQKFGSKIQALQYKKKTGLEPNFYYFDDAYNKVNWLVEPPHSLQHYYIQQAQRIRDNYDYVVLCYSGGYDSTNVLETFHFNNIKLDKIVIVGALSQDSSSKVDENHNGELYHNAFPYVEQLGLSSITEIIDYTKYFTDISQFSIVQHHSEWIHETGGWFSPHNFFWRDIENFVIPSSFKDKKTAIIFGKDKPYITIKNRKFGFEFKDICISSYGTKNLLDHNGCDRINFYWDPSYPDILVKQLHVLLQQYVLSRFNLRNNSEMGHDVIGNMSINDIIYNLKRPITFKSPKSPLKVISLRDMYFLNKKNSDIFKFYESGIELLKSKFEWNEVTNMDIIHSKFYSIT